MEYLSKKRYDEIAAELNHLINVVYPQVREDVAETSAQGDRSENAGYREARRKQAKTISRIRFLQKILEHSRVIDPEALPKDIVCPPLKTVNPYFFDFASPPSGVPTGS